METKKIVFRAAPRRRKKRLVLLTVLVLLLTVCAAVSTIAWLTVRDTASNEFTVGQVGAQLSEDFDTPFTEKKNVKVQSTGNVPEYVRATVSIYWQLADGTIDAQPPEEGTDYTIQWDNTKQWIKKGDIWYCLAPLAENGETAPLIVECKVNGTHQGGNLVVDVAVQAIQAQPARAVEEAWGVTVGQDGMLQLTP